MRSHSIHPPVLMLNDIPLKRVSSYICLGVLIIRLYVVITYYFQLYKRVLTVYLMYRKFFKYSSCETLLKLYASFIRPTLNMHALPAMGPHSIEGHYCP